MSIPRCLLSSSKRQPCCTAYAGCVLSWLYGEQKHLYELLILLWHTTISFGVKTEHESLSVFYSQRGLWGPGHAKSVAPPQLTNRSFTPATRLAKLSSGQVEISICLTQCSVTHHKPWLVVLGGWGSPPTCAAMTSTHWGSVAPPTGAKHTVAPGGHQHYDSWLQRKIDCERGSSDFSGQSTLAGLPFSHVYGFNFLFLKEKLSCHFMLSQHTFRKSDTLVGEARWDPFC